MGRSSKNNGGSSNKKKRKQPPSSDVADISSPSPSTAQHVDPASVKKLSGSTMNMRFMQRLSAKTITTTAVETTTAPMNGLVQETATTATATTTPPKFVKPAPLTNDEMQVDSEAINNNNSATIASSQSSNDITTTTTTTSTFITPLDIYGPVAQLPGRRSFGGFNKNTEELWHAAYKKSTQQAKVAKVTDEDLLRRYSDFANSNRNSNNNDIRRN